MNIIMKCHESLCIFLRYCDIVIHKGSSSFGKVLANSALSDRIFSPGLGCCSQSFLQVLPPSSSVII